MSAFYNFWQSSKHVQLLQDMCESIRPNITLQYLIEGIISQIGSKYIAIHLRIEADKLKFDDKKDNNDKVYYDNVYKIIEFAASYSSVFHTYYDSTLTTIGDNLSNSQLIKKTSHLTG